MLTRDDPGGSYARIRRRLGDVFLATRLDTILARLFAHQGIILALHRIAPTLPEGPLSGLSVTETELDACIRLLRDRGYAIISMSDAVRRLADPSSRGRFAVLTFDDAYRDNHDRLPDLLERHQVPALVYVTTGFVDRTVAMWWYGLDELIRAHPEIHVDGQPFRSYYALRDRVMEAGPAGIEAVLAALSHDYGVDFTDHTDRHAMDWVMLRRLSRSRWVELGGHGVRHVPIARLDSAAAHAEITGCRDRMHERLGRPPEHFGFPYGDRASVSARDVRLAQQAGYITAATSIPGPLRAGAVNLHALPRVVLGGAMMVDRLRVALCGLLDEPPLEWPSKQAAQSLHHPPPPRRRPA